MKLRSWIALASLVVLVFSAETAEAAKAPCTTTAAGYVGNAAINAMVYDTQAASAAIANYVKSPVTSTSSTGNPFACIANLWPGMTGGFHLPTMDQLINGIIAAAVQEACSAARTEIAQATSGLSSSIVLNTGIPGMPTVSGSLSSVIGSSTTTSSTVSSTTSSLSNSLSTYSTSGLSSSLSNVGTSATSTATSVGNSVSSGWSAVQSLF